MLGLAGEEAVRRPSELWPEFLGVPVPGGDSEMPPLPGYVGFISYDVGRELEPRARWGGGARGDRSIPSMFFRRVEEGLAFDHWKRRWWCVGERARRLARQIEPSGGAGPPGPCWGRPVSQSGQAAYLAGVARALEYIRAGDAYQVNVAHRLSAPFSGGARGVFRGLCAMVRPWHGVYVEGSGFAVASASPELFLCFDPVTRVLRTRPMKGTRPAALEGAFGDLERSEKDRAELAMIVDLMRNDLGRVCELGSVRVETVRRIERHDSGVLQATACGEGVLRAGLTLRDALGATFPAGSVTGAPKIRAMQIIDELEPVRRGVYCGSAGYVGDDGRAMLNVAIRTAVVTGRAGGGPGEFEEATLDYSVGAGIVADSDPGTEWQETLDKAAAVSALVR